MASRAATLWARIALAAVLVMQLYGAAALKTSSSSCAVPRAPQFLALPRCAPSNKTLEDAAKVGWKFAPVIYTTKLETYQLQSPDVWYNASEIFYQDLKNESQSIFSWMSTTPLDTLMFMPRSFATLINSTTISKVERDAVMGGAPFVDGRSTARLFYSVEEVYGMDGPGRDMKIPGLWAYTYHIFYSWNGCSNQDFALSLNGTRNVVQYLLCPYGVHEGDWEHVSMLVCAEDETIQQTAYSQHGWWETRDCTQAGQCPMEADDQGLMHPVTYAGFESHANYYEQSPLMVYAWKNASFKGVSLDNLGGVWVGDRTLADTSRKFMPTADNVVRVPSVQEIEDKNLTGWDWALYPGNWGAPLRKQNTTFYCINLNESSMSPCLDSAATRAMQTAFRLLDTVSVATGGGSLMPNVGMGFDDETYRAQASNNNTWVSPAAITGPLYRTWSYQWLPERHSPIFDDFSDNDTLTCPFDTEITLAFPDVHDFRTATTVQTIVNYLVGICVGAIIVSALFVLLLTLPSLAIKTLSAPKVLLAYGGRAVRKAPAALRGMKDKLKSSSDELPGLQDGGTGNGSVGTLMAASALIQPTTGGEEVAAFGTAQPMVAAAGLAPGTGTGTGAAAMAPAHTALDAVAKLPSAVSEGSQAQIDAALQEMAGENTAKTLWLLWAGALWIAAVVLLSLGTAQLINNSVASKTAKLLGNSSVVQAVHWLVIGSLILTALCDLAALFTVMLSRRPTLTLWRWRVRNYLYSSWVHHHVFRITVGLAGLMIMAISLSCILFGLGLVIVTVQLAVRLACSQVAGVNVDKITVSDICLTIPAVSEDPICGWQVLEICYDITDMGVLSLVLGAMLLLWSHVVWLILLLLSIWRHLDWKVVLPKQEMAVAGSPHAPISPTDSMHSGSSVVGAGQAAGSGQHSPGSVRKGLEVAAAAALVPPPFGSSDHV